MYRRGDSAIEARLRTRNGRVIAANPVPLPASPPARPLFAPAEGQP
jgi:hypothetical protein